MAFPKRSAGPANYPLPVKKKAAPKKKPAPPPGARRAALPLHKQVASQMLSDTDQDGY